MKKQESKTPSLLAGLFLLLFCSVIWYCFFYKQESEIGLVATDETSNPFIIPVEIDGMTYRFLWDTGSYYSFIDHELIADTKYRAKLEHFELATYNEIVSDTLAYAKLTIGLGELSVKADFILDGYKRYIVTETINSDDAAYDTERCVGIIGQNIISKYHWLFDFEGKTVRINNFGFSTDGDQDNVFKMSFDLATTIPSVNLEVDDLGKQSFIFDTGYHGKRSVYFSDSQYDVYSGFSFSDDLIIELQQVRTVQPEVLKVNRATLNLLFDTIQINDKIFAPVVISRNNFNPKSSYNFITANFSRRFRSMYYDSGNKEISFYTSPQDSSFTSRGKEEKQLFELVKNLRGDRLKKD